VQQLRVVYPALAVAACCAIASRLLDFVPGYAYGLVLAYGLVAGQRQDVTEVAKRQKAVAVLRASGLMLALALAAGLLERFGTAPYTGDGRGAPFALALIDSTLAMITMMALEVLVVGLMPLRFLRGREVWAWSRPAWFAVYVPSLGAFTVVLMGPYTSEWKHLVRAMTLFIMFFAGSFAFWAYFALRGRMSGSA
jgi:hypothetical protein